MRPGRHSGRGDLPHDWLKLRCGGARLLIHRALWVTTAPRLGWPIALQPELFRCVRFGTAGGDSGRGLCRNSAASQRARSARMRATGQQLPPQEVIVRRLGLPLLTASLVLGCGSESDSAGDESSEAGLGGAVAGLGGAAGPDGATGGTVAAGGSVVAGGTVAASWATPTATWSGLSARAAHRASTSCVSLRASSAMSVALVWSWDRCWGYWATSSVTPSRTMRTFRSSSSCRYGLGRSSKSRSGWNRRSRSDAA